MTEYYYTLKGTFIRSVFFWDLRSDLYLLIYLTYPISPSVLLLFFSYLEDLLKQVTKIQLSLWILTPPVTTATPLWFTATWTLHWLSQNYVGCILKQESFPRNDLIRLWWKISPGRSSKPCHQHYLNLLPLLIIFIIALSMNPS